MILIYWGIFTHCSGFYGAVALHSLCKIPLNGHLAFPGWLPAALNSQIPLQPAEARGGVGAPLMAMHSASGYYAQAGLEAGSSLVKSDCLQVDALRRVHQMLGNL